MRTRVRQRVWLCVFVFVEMVSVMSWRPAEVWFVFHETQIHYNSSQSHISWRIKSWGLWLQYQLENEWWRVSTEYLFTVKTWFMESLQSLVLGIPMPFSAVLYLNAAPLFIHYYIQKKNNSRSSDWSIWIISQGQSVAEFCLLLHEVLLERIWSKQSKQWQSEYVL